MRRSEKEKQQTSRLPFLRSDSPAGATNERFVIDQYPERIHGVEQLHPFAAAAAADPSLYLAPRIHGVEQLHPFAAAADDDPSLYLAPRIHGVEQLHPFAAAAAADPSLYLAPRIHGVEQLHPFAAAAADPSLYLAPRIHGQNQQSSDAFGAGAFTNSPTTGLQPSTSYTRNYNDDLDKMLSSIHLGPGQGFPSTLGGSSEIVDPIFSYPSSYINAGARGQQGRSLDAFYSPPHLADHATASYPNYSFPGPSSFLGNGNAGGNAFTGLPTHPNLNPMRNTQVEFNQNRTSSPITSHGSSSSMPLNFNLVEFDAARISSSPTTPHLPTEFDDNLRNLHDQIYEMAKDRKFTRFLQTKLEGKSPEDVGIIFDELFNHLRELMVDPYACRVLQKLFEVCNEEQRLKIVLLLTQDPRKLFEISTNASGTKTVQKLIGSSLGTGKHVEAMKLAIEPFCLKYMKNAHGYHVISQCLKSFTEEYKQFIFQTAEIHCVELAKDQSGCVILQDCLRESSGLIRSILIEKITTNGLQLARDKFGNYVVQLALDLSDPSALSTLASLFSGHFSDLSTDQCSSNVVEKCLKCFSTTDSGKIVNELLSAPQFEQLLQHPYANYVIQAALENTKGSVHSKLTQKIILHSHALRTNPHSKGILSRIKNCVHSKLTQEIILHSHALRTNPHSKGILSRIKNCRGCCCSSNVH